MSQRIISWNQCLNHITKESCWIVIQDNVYDVTAFLNEHPGGQQPLLKHCGTNATRKFDQIGHSAYAKSIMKNKVIGKIQTLQPSETYLRILKDKKQKKSGNRKSLQPRESIPLSEVAQHNTQDSLWVIIDEKVYDITRFIYQHPGGVQPLKFNAGKNATQNFLRIGHSDKAKQLMQQFYIGTVEKKNNFWNWIIPTIIFAIEGIIIFYHLKKVK